MGRQRHKRKKNRVIIVTSDAVNAGLRQYRFRPVLLWMLVFFFFVASGAAISYFYYEREALKEQLTQAAVQQETVEMLMREKADLEKQVAVLNKTVEDLNETLSQKTQTELLLSEQLEKQMNPTEFPLSGSATIKEVTEGDFMCIFTTTSGTMVVATAGGTVIAVNDDNEFGHNIWVDHGNGYVTVYRNSGEVKVKQNELVKQGTTLFLINDEGSELGYQMLKDGVYINPMDMLNING